MTNYTGFIYDQFPVELVERCILALTNENSWVLDPFAGVGSTIIAALKNNRHAVGIEKEKDYCTIAHNRIKDLKKGRLKIRPINKPIHKPSVNNKISQIPKEWKELELDLIKFSSSGKYIGKYKQIYYGWEPVRCNENKSARS